MTIRVHEAAADDADAVAALAALTFPLACPASSVESEILAFVAEHLTAERFASYIADPDRTVLLAHTGDALVGYAMLIRTDPADPDVAAALTIRPSVEVSKVYVHADAHGSGVAKALMDAAVADAAARGVPGLWLGVNNENVRAQTFYAKCGFTAVGTKTFTMGSELHHDYVLERPTVL